MKAIIIKGVEMPEKEGFLDARIYGDGTVLLPTHMGECDTVKAKEVEIPSEYKYGMRLRGYSPGAQPKGVLRREDDPTGRYHDIIVYERQLSADDIRNYELEELT